MTLNLDKHNLILHKNKTLGDIVVKTETDRVHGAKQSHQTNLELVGSHQKNELIAVLNDYRDCRAKSSLELGCTNLVTMDTDLKELSRFQENFIIEIINIGLI